MLSPLLEVLCVRLDNLYVLVFPFSQNPLSPNLSGNCRLQDMHQANVNKDIERQQSYLDKMKAEVRCAGGRLGSEATQQRAPDSDLKEYGMSRCDRHSYLQSEVQPAQ